MQFSIEGRKICLNEKVAFEQKFKKLKSQLRETQGMIIKAENTTRDTLKQVRTAVRERVSPGQRTLQETHPETRAGCNQGGAVTRVKKGMSIKG